MKKMRVLFLILTLGLLPALLFTSPLMGASGQDFGGFYQFSDVSQQGNSYQLTFKARIFNYSGSDISNATVTLVNPMNPRQPYASFTGISISKNGSTLVSGSIAIPSREYQRWQDGGQPQVLIGFVDSEGQSHLEPVQLIHRPVR